MRNYEFDRAHWPILMVLMWIAARQRKFIEAASEAESSDGPRYAKPNPQSLDTFLAFEELTQKLPDGEMTSIAAARQAFESEARKGTLTISGVREGREHTVLSTLQLQCLKLVEYNTEFIAEPGCWSEILVKRDDILLAWPDVDVKIVSRKRGRESIDDSNELAEMSSLIESGKAKTPSAAARIAVLNAQGGGTEDSIVRRLVKKFKKLNV